MFLFHIGTGLFFLILGYLIKVNKWSWLISGYNTASTEQKAKYDQKALCNGVGSFMYLLGFTQFIVSIGFWREVIVLQIMGWVLFVVAVIVFLIYANTGNRYKK